MKVFIESTRSLLKNSWSWLLRMCSYCCFCSVVLVLLLWTSYLRLFVPVTLMLLWPDVTLQLFLSPSLQVQENVFVDFNHQELLEFYNKVCCFGVCVFVRTWICPCSCFIYIFVFQWLSSMLHFILIGRRCLKNYICLPVFLILW